MSSNTNTHRNSEIIKLVEDGVLSYAQIAKLYNITRARVGQIVMNSSNSDAVRVEHAKQKQKHKELKEKENIKILEHAYKHNMSYMDIVEKYGKTVFYWKGLAEKFGYDDKIFGQRELIAKRNEEIVEFLKNGHSQKEAAEKFGIIQSAVSNVAIENGIRRRLTGTLLEQRNEELVKKKLEGYTNAQLAEEYNVSYVTVCKVIRESGIKT